MSELFILNCIIIAWFAVAAIVFVTLFFFVAPYGRHTRKGWGPATASRFGWILMEAPAALVFTICFAFGLNARTIPAWSFWFYGNSITFTGRLFTRSRQEEKPGG